MTRPHESPDCRCEGCRVDTAAIDQALNEMFNRYTQPPTFHVILSTGQLSDVIDAMLRMGEITEDEAAEYRRKLEPVSDGGGLDFATYIPDPKDTR